MSDQSKNLSWPIGFPVRKTTPPLLSEITTAIVAKDVPCYGSYSKDVPVCKDECLLRDMCRVALGTFAASQIPSLLASEAASEQARELVALNPVAPVAQWKKVHNRKNGVRCATCAALIDVGVDLYMLRGTDIVRHIGCANPNDS